ncbi:MAG: hypothetical protein HYY58_00670 [Candidatus Omnitrophica bacterium]|nr:hypothetical protein [Candidatus Omnitrophota bacterium]
MEKAIAVLTDVKDLSEVLDGASVDRVCLIPSGGRLRLEMELTRACPELNTVVRRGFLTKTKTPWVKGRLSLGQIKDASVERMAETPADQPPLLLCETVPGGYTLVVTSPDGLRLSLTLEQLEGQFADIGRPVDSP